MSGQPARKTRMSAPEYDARECAKQMQQVATGTIIMLLLHYYFGLVQPLFLQILLPWKGVVTQPLVQIHLYGFAASGPLKRPFKTPSPFAEFMNEPAAEPAAEEATTPSNTEDASPSGAAAAASEANRESKKTNNKKKNARKED